VLMAKEETTLQGMIVHMLHRNRLLKQVTGGQREREKDENVKTRKKT